MTHLYNFKFNPIDSKKKFYSNEDLSQNQLEEMRQCIRDKQFVKIWGYVPLSDLKTF